MSYNLQTIAQRCGRDNPLSNKETRNIILTLTDTIKNFIQTHENNGSVQYMKTKLCVNNVCADEEMIRISETLQKKIAVLDEKISKIYAEIQEEIFMKSENIVKQFNPLIEQNANQAKKFNETLEDLEEHVRLKIKKQNVLLEERLSKILQRELKSIKSSIQTQQQKLQKVLNELGYKKQQNKDINIDCTVNIINDEQNKKEPEQINAEDWVDHSCCLYKSHTLTFSQNFVTSCSSKSMVFGKQKLCGRSCFAVTLDNIKSYAGLGVIDSSYKNNDNLNNLENKVWYFSDGDCVIGAEHLERQGHRLKMGQKVKVCVDFTAGTIEWKVGDQVRHKVQYDKLKDCNITYVPYIILWNKGDSVRVHCE